MPEGFYKTLFGPICAVPKKKSILNCSWEEIGSMHVMGVGGHN